MNLSSAYDVRAENVWIYVYVKSSKREFQQWRMVLWSAFRRGGGDEALPYLAYTGQVCAAEQKVLSIKQGVEFYYFSSKILIIYFIIYLLFFA